MTDRVTELKQIQHLLNSPEGETFVEELAIAWDSSTLMGETSERTAYQVGQRDAFKFIKMLQTGELIHE